MKRVTSQLTALRKERNVLPALKESVEVAVAVAVVVIVVVSPVSLVSLDPLWPALTVVKRVTDLPTALTKPRKVLLMPVKPLQAVDVEVTVTVVDSMARHVRMLTLWIELTELDVHAVATARLVPAAEAGVVTHPSVVRVRRRPRRLREPTVPPLRRRRELPARDVSALPTLKRKRRKLASPSTTTLRPSKPSLLVSSAKPRT
jgi:hypothetical protein